MAFVDKGVRSLKTQKSLLRKFAKATDTKVNPNKQFLAILLLGYLEGQYPFQLIEWLYGGKTSITSDLKIEDILNQEGKQNLDDVYKRMLGGENADINSTSPAE